MGWDGEEHRTSVFRRTEKYRNVQNDWIIAVYIEIFLQVIIKFQISSGLPVLLITAIMYVDIPLIKV